MFFTFLGMFNKLLFKKSLRKRKLFFGYYLLLNAFESGERIFHTLGIGHPVWDISTGIRRILVVYFSAAIFRGTFPNRYKLTNAYCISIGLQILWLRGLRNGNNTVAFVLFYFYPYYTISVFYRPWGIKKQMCNKLLLIQARYNFRFTATGKPCFVVIKISKEFNHVIGRS